MFILSEENVYFNYRKLHADFILLVRTQQEMLFIVRNAFSATSSMVRVLFTYNQKILIAMGHYKYTFCVK